MVLILRMNDGFPLGIETFSKQVVPQFILYMFPSRGEMRQQLHRISSQSLSITFQAESSYLLWWNQDVAAMALARLLHIPCEPIIILVPSNFESVFVSCDFSQSDVTLSHLIGLLLSSHSVPRALPMVLIGKSLLNRVPQCIQHHSSFPCHNQYLDSFIIL